MTPGIDAARRAGVAFEIHAYDHDPVAVSYGMEAVEKLAVAPERVFKTLVVDSGGAFAVAVIPVAAMLSLKKVARAAGAKRAAMADGDSVERVTGYVLGGVSPLGQRKRLATFVDRTAADHASIYVSAGRRGLEIELAPADLLALTRGALADLQA